MKPNHHYSVHLPEQLRDFGPVYEFWTFLTERLNKILKSYNSNSWGGGHLEVSMMRHFDREVRVQNLVSLLLDCRGLKYSKFLFHRLSSCVQTQIMRPQRQWSIGFLQRVRKTEELLKQQVPQRSPATVRTLTWNK
jgi:hypothetical protein